MNRLMALAFGVLLTCLPCCTVQNVQSDAPRGYAWSANLAKPRKLVLTERGTKAWLQAGNYDVATVPVGDNWMATTVGAYTSIKLDRSSTISVLPRFPVNEPSCGFFILLRGPYADETAVSSRGEWKVNSLGGGQPYRRASLPVYTHCGARYDRYGQNGYVWLGDGGYPVPDVTGTTTALGPKKFYTTDRVALSPCATGPDVTILSQIPNQTIYLAIALVDMLGRETPISDPLEIAPAALDQQYSTYAIVRRDIDSPMGTCGFRVYAGFSPGDLHRQPVLNYSGSTDKFLWPVFLQSFVLHNIRTDTPAPCPSDTVQSLLNWPQQQVVNGLSVIQQAGVYDLYCPFVLHYDSLNFGREICGKATYWHQSTYNGQPIETDIPCLMIQNQKDRISGMLFISDKAIAGVATNDWSGGQAFSNILSRCVFRISGPESYGMLVDERSSALKGSHTASEIRLDECTFWGTVPCKFEGNQTANIRYKNNCEFEARGNTRYPADTVGTIYQVSPSDIHVRDMIGASGQYRSFCCVGAEGGPSNLTFDSLFIDGGCSVYTTFCANQGGTVRFQNGERVNTMPGQQWARLAEAPTVFNANVIANGVRFHTETSSVSFMLNQLCLDLDFAVAEVVAPTEASWQAKGLVLQYPNAVDITNPAYFDFTKKRRTIMPFGYGNVPDSTPPTILPSVVN